MYRGTNEAERRIKLICVRHWAIHKKVQKMVEVIFVSYGQFGSFVKVWVKSIWSRKDSNIVMPFSDLHNPYVPSPPPTHALTFVECVTYEWIVSFIFQNNSGDK